MDTSSVPTTTVVAETDGCGGPTDAGAQQHLHQDEVTAAAEATISEGGGSGGSALVAEQGNLGVEDEEFCYLDIETAVETDGGDTASGKEATTGSGEKVVAATPAVGPGVVASASKELLVKLVRSLSTPMMDGLDDWAGVEDPDWKANHQLSWEQLTDVREIGKGLTCTVYTARIPGRKAKVIAKVARPRNKGRLEDQAERQLEAEFNPLRRNPTPQVNHPHVVELLGAGFTHEGRRFILLEHLPEGTLGTFHALSDREQMRGPSAYHRTLKQGFRRMTKDLSYTLGRVLQVAEALQYLHNDAIPEGAVVLHRDVRPDNIGLARGDVVKMFDFGLSKAIAKGHSLVGEAGSLRYAAPEVSMALPHGEKADVYSWALLAWAVASGRTPFEGIGRSAFYARVVIGGERPQVDPSWPRAFKTLLKDCWSGDPSLRPDIAEVVVRMKAILHVSP
ncbi:unnamed protein product [Ectocarpus sp. 12 AP-2014]